jgi:hypothetical protein
MGKPMKTMIEDLRMLMLDPPWNDFTRLVRMVDSVSESPELERLTTEELRRIKSFRITLHRAAAMEADTMLKHVAAEWMGCVEQAVRKLSIGTEAVRAVTSMMDAPVQDRVAFGTIT